MKILFISPSLPMNTGSGGAMRSHHILQELKSFAAVDVVTCSSRIEPASAARFREQNNYLGNIVVQNHSYLDPTSITSGMPGQSDNGRLQLLSERLGFLDVDDRYRKKLERMVEVGDYDYVFVRYYEVAQKLKLFDLDNLILDCDDCFLELAEQFMGVLRAKYVSDLQKPKRVLFARKSEQIKWDDNFSTFPNRIVTDNGALRPCPESETTTMLFVGVLDYPPNLFGLNHFVRNIWPRIFSLRPQARLKIVGRGLPSSFRKAWSQIDGLQICGFVANIELVYSDVHFAVLPIYQGSGTHIKVLDSLIRGRTIVMSRLAHRGYEKTLLDGESVFVADNDADFVDRVLCLVDNQSVRRRMSSVGREAILQHHGVNASNGLLKDLMDQKFWPDLEGSAGEGVPTLT